MVPTLAIEPQTTEQALRSADKQETLDRQRRLGVVSSDELARQRALHRQHLKLLDLQSWQRLGGTPLYINSRENPKPCECMWGYGDLAEYMSKRNTEALKLRTIARQCCGKYGVTMEEFIGPRRTRAASFARIEYGYRAREETGQSFPVIAGVAGRRDHTTAVYWQKRFTEHAHKEALDAFFTMLAKRKGG